MAETEKPLGYFFSQKKDFLVVSLSGDATPESQEVLKQCAEEIKRIRDVAFVVINMSGVSSMSREAVQFFAQIQKEARSKPAQLRICNLASEVKDRLIKLGVVRSLEIADSLDIALAHMTLAARRDSLKERGLPSK